MPRRDYQEFQEILPGDLNLQHKIALSTEKNTYHRHSHLEIIFTVSDNLVLFTESKAQRIPAGAILLLDSMSLHYIDCTHDRKNCDRYVLYFRSNLISDLRIPEINLLDCFLRRRGDAQILLPDAQQRSIIRDILERMIACYPQISSAAEDLSSYKHDPSSVPAALSSREDSPALSPEASPALSQGLPHALKGDASVLPPEDRLFLRLELGHLLLLIHRIIRRTEKSPETASYQAHSRAVSDIRQYIDTHYSEELAVDNIAREFLMSRTMLYNLFKEVMHMSVSDYLTHVRITQAKALLINTDYSVEIISQMAGYGNISSFSRVFKARTGVTPLQYRKKQQNRNPLSYSSST